MNEYAKTGAFVAGAVLLSLGAVLVRPGAVSNAAFDDEGQVFFADFTNPDQAFELEVTDWQKELAKAKVFDVKQDDKGRWAIPSHHGYPADGKQRMAKAATMLIGLKKQKAVSDLVAAHKDFEVLDPKAEGAGEGCGRRVVFKDKNSTVLGDLIVGKAVEGKSGMRYVRVPGKKRVYQASIDADVSTRFADWIETDLMKTSSWDMKQVVIDNYKVDEAARSVVPGERFVIKKDATEKWVLDGLSTDEVTNEDKAREVADAAAQLKIVGVRRKPAGLTAEFKLEKGADPNAVLASLLDAGYFPARDGVYSNEGELQFATKKGIVYTLRFGELVPGEGDAVTAGGEAPKAKEPKPGETGPQPVAANNRYLMISVAFDEALLDKPNKPRPEAAVLDLRKQAKEQIAELTRAIASWQEKHDKKLPDALARLTEGDAPPLKELKKDPWGQDYLLAVTGETYVVSSKGPDQQPGGEGPAAADVRSDQLPYEDELATLANDWKGFDSKVEDGKKELAKLSARFGPWYYVIDKAAFDKLKPGRKDLVKPKPPATPPAEGQKPGEPPLPGGNGK